MGMQKSIAIISILWLWTSCVMAVEVNNIRMWAAPDNTRLVFDLTAKIHHTVFILENPDRVVVNLENVHFNPILLKHLRYKKTVLKNIRYGKDNQHTRLVLDLNQTVRPKSFLLLPNKSHIYYRLVIDLYKQGGKKVIRKTYTDAKQYRSKDIIVAIDAGHGGEDPGAIGKGKIKEKNVVLKIAKLVAKRINSEKGMQAILIRKGDYYIRLRDRNALARKYNADIFVSIHADAFRDWRARGSSVFILSRKGASSETARWLAQKENNSDMAGGFNLDDKSDFLRETLLDLSMTASIKTSNDVASRVLNGLKKIGKVHKNHVERAGFVVLKSPDIPALLVETGFISNPSEARKLNTSYYQNKLAYAIFKGIKEYFRKYPPLGTYFAQLRHQQHIVVSGDTLLKIARKYQVSLTALRKANNIKGDMLRVGKVLHIPVAR